MSRVCWASIDPVRKQINFYPKIFGSKIEKSYLNTDIKCDLGTNFFNATINFHHNGIISQTTPGINMGRVGYKQPGYRSVMRIIVPENNECRIYAKYIHNELRHTNFEDDSDRTFNETIPLDTIIDSEVLDTPSVPINAWTHIDISSEFLDTNVVVWQWCRGVYERQGNLMALGDKWWIPYLNQQNREIEEAFCDQAFTATITLPVINTERIIRFIPDSCFATQNDLINHKTRQIRRKIMTVRELQIMIKKMGELPPDPGVLTSIIDPDDIPHEFFCCISQDVMTDPVTTIDGHIYERSSISRWFIDNSTSPLTGLGLTSRELTPNLILRKQIEEFTRQKLALSIAT
jgi:hypothetical protein